MWTHFYVDVTHNARGGWSKRIISELSLFSLKRKRTIKCTKLRKNFFARLIVCTSLLQLLASEDTNNSAVNNESQSLKGVKNDDDEYSCNAKNYRIIEEREQLEGSNEDKDKVELSETLNIKCVTLGVNLRKL
ncbi:hypothetical protein Tcan_17483 [Toxocara canis]|uniref:Uncharacterized protein n=1 Tax=Toxocara canis TaxID=6265 RepID=A0A0B2VLQ3_TOXCA|nr:hypothetical protein Tcan_17483 [Toxocara canis]